MKDITITPESINAFRRNMVYRELSEATIKKYTNAVKEFADFLGGVKVDKEQVLKYRMYLQSKNQARTVNAKISGLNSFFTFLGMMDCKVKLLKVQRRSFVQEIKDLSEDDYFILLEEANRQGNIRLYYIMLAICNTGLRVSELQFLTVEALSEGGVRVFLKGKNRVVLLPKMLIELLLLYAESCGISTGPIFRTRTGKPVNRSNICHEMKRVCIKAGLEPGKVFPHNLRHLFAKTFYKEEKNLSHLADILGHSSIETTRIYVASSAKEYERILNKMNLIPQNVYSVV